MRWPPAAAATGRRRRAARRRLESAAEEEAVAAMRRSEWRDGRGGITELRAGFDWPQRKGRMERSRGRRGFGVLGRKKGRRIFGLGFRVLDIGRRVSGVPGVLSGAHGTGEDEVDDRKKFELQMCAAKWKQFAQNIESINLWTNKSKIEPPSEKNQEANEKTIA
jgi:hypothetical protein